MRVAPAGILVTLTYPKYPVSEQSQGRAWAGPGGHQGDGAQRGPGAGTSGTCGHGGSECPQCLWTPLGTQQRPPSDGTAPSPCPCVLGTGRDQGRGSWRGDGTKEEPGGALGTRTGDRGAKSQSIHPWRGPGQWFIHRRRGPSPGRAGARTHTSRGRRRSGRRRPGASPSPGSRHSPRSAGTPDTPSAPGWAPGGSGGFWGGLSPARTHQAAPPHAQIRGAGAAAGPVQHPPEAVVEVVSLGQAVEVAEVWRCRSRVGRGCGDAGDSTDPTPRVAVTSPGLTSVEGHPAVAGGGAQDGSVVVERALHGPERHGAAGAALGERHDGAPRSPRGLGTARWLSRRSRRSPAAGRAGTAAGPPCTAAPRCSWGRSDSV